MKGQAKRLAAGAEHVVSPAHTPGPVITRIARNISILTVPSIATVVTLIAAWQWRHQPLSLFDGILSSADGTGQRSSEWLSWGHAIVPAVFLVTNLVNRRYGEDYAIAHVLVSWTFAVVVSLAVLAGILPLSPEFTQAPPLRVAAAFLMAMVLGQLAGVYVFDRTRGVAWWNAPAYGALAGSFVAMPVFYLFAFIGTDRPWLNHLSIDLGLKALASFALLVPYFLLRQVIPPRPGLGGY